MRTWMVFACVAALNLPAFGQEAGSERPTPKRKLGNYPQPQYQGENRARSPRAEWSDGSGGELLKRLHELRDELGLSSEQSANFDDLLARYENRLVERRGANGRGLGQFREQENDADDPDRVLTRRVAQMRSRQTALDQFFGDVDRLLEDPQREQLKEVRGQLRLPASTESLRIMAGLPMLERELGLQGEPAEKFAALAAELEHKLRNKPRTQMDDQKREELLEKVRAAAEAGDEGALRELGDQYGPPASPSSDALDDFVAQLTPMLSSEQRDLLADFADRTVMGAGSLGGAGTPGDLRNIIRAAKRCDLSRGQASELRVIERDSVRRVRKDREDAATVARDARQQIEEMLDETQLTQFQDALTRLESGRQRREAGRSRTPQPVPAEAEGVVEEGEPLPVEGEPLEEPAPEEQP